MSAEHIAKELGNAKQVNGQWVASCPVPSHGQGKGDKNPSLSISEDDSGKYLFHCHAGCNQLDVFECIRDRHLLPELPPKPDVFASLSPITYTQKPKTLMELEQEWHYRNEDGDSLFIKRRYKTDTEKGKDYRLVRNDGVKGHGLGDVRIVPYALPSLLQAKSAGRAIYLCEGEKAADAVIGLGATATTSHTGAGSWPDAITEYFAGANVVILPDNDAAGWQHAKRVVKELFGIAKTIRIVTLPVTGLGDDAVEWIEGGGTRALLAELAKSQEPLAGDVIDLPPQFQEKHKFDFSAFDAAMSVGLDDDDYPDYLPSNDDGIDTLPAPPTRKRFQIESWDAIKDEPVEWLIEGVVPHKSFSALFGPPASFKSFIALDIAEAIAAGRHWMGKAVINQGAVLQIIGEGHGGVGARMKACRIHNETPDDTPIFVIRHQLNLRNSREDIELLLVEVDALVVELNRREQRLQLIQIDTLARSFGGGNENASEAMGEWVINVGRIQNRYDCAVMVVHHNGKNLDKGLRGHSSLLGAVDTELEITRVEGKAEGLLTITKQKDGEDGAIYPFVCVEIPLSEGPFPLISLAIKGAGDDVTNSVEQHKSKQSALGKGKNQKKAYEAFLKVMKENFIQQTEQGGNKRVVLVSAVRQELLNSMGVDVSNSAELKHFNTIWYRSKEQLSEHYGVQIDGKLMWRDSLDYQKGQHKEAF